MFLDPLKSLNLEKLNSNIQITIMTRKSTQQMCPMYNVLLCLSLDGDVQ